MSAGRRFLLSASLTGASLAIAGCSGEFSTAERPSDAGADARPSSGGSSSGTGGAAAGGRVTSGGAGGRNSGGGPSSGGSATGGAGAGGSAGAGGASAGGAGGAGTGGAGTGGTSSGGSGAGGSPPRCEPACGFGLECCNGRCINPDNDILSCGGCGQRCDGATPYCGGGTCTEPPCFADICPGSELCCGAECCAAGQLCCTVNVGPSVTRCTDPVEGTCPVGCPGCVCASPDTPIATPSGEVAIAALRPGDLVLSVDRGEMRVVPVQRVHREPVTSHQMVRLTFPDGRTLEMSPGHPTADGRTLADLTRGDTLGGVRILEREVVPYAHPFTYDILPDSDTGTYVASGALVGSTLWTESAAAGRCEPPRDVH